MSSAVPFPRSSRLRVAPSTGTRFGRIIAEIDALPRALVSSPDRLSGADLALAADHLTHAAQRLRALAEVYGSGEGQ